MILTGTQIKKEIKKGNITVVPFNANGINPNTYNYHLGHFLKIYDHFDDNKSVFRLIKIPSNGFILTPGQLYLGHTLEIIGSKKYATSLIGRSSMGRLGLFLQTSANLGHTGEIHQWTLEIVATQRIKIYPEMTIGQVSFWTNLGKIKKYRGKYEYFNNPQECLI